jgi:hemolysin III
MDLLHLHLREPLSAWSHGLWFVLALPGTILLWQRSRGSLAKRVSLLVFGISLAFCFAGSTLFHSVRASAENFAFFDRLDHIGIYILIAGSYTPLAWNLFQGRWRWGVLTTAWLSAIAGTALLMIMGEQPLKLSTAVYLALGWGSIPCYFQLANAFSHRTVCPLLLGGLLYSAGAILNVLHWPVLWNGTIRAHDIFHFWVMGGSLAHYWFMLRVVAPFSRSA